MDEETRLLQKIMTRKQVIIKNGTYNMVREPIPSPESDENPEYQEDTSVLETAELSEEQDAKIAEIMNKFASNIQDNVSSLFN